jgi:hemerythrin
MIKKSRLGSGFCYIEIEELGFSMLCGAPCDAIKHVKRNGFSKEVVYKKSSLERGPNAVLLSDVDIQNSQVSNASEFIILHILYKQGVFNFKNIKEETKPILIGTKDVLKRQKQYISLGNYGFTSKELLVANSMKQELAIEQLEIKKKFAFGEFLDINNILKCVEIEAETEIKKSIFIKRVSLNKFEIRYKKFKEIIDLNLEQNGHYKTPYKNDFVNNKKSDFAVIHTGLGDGWSMDDGSMSTLLSCGFNYFMIDSPTNLSYFLHKLGIGINEIEAVFVTHCHDDHFLGFVDYIRRGTKIKSYAIGLINAQIKEKLFVLTGICKQKLEQMIEFIDLQLGEWNMVDGLEVRPMLSAHPVDTTIFDFRMKNSLGEYKTYGHYADIASVLTLKKLGMSSHYIDAMHKEYTKTLDIKKVDVGGGVAHGDLEDFKNDETKDIIVAHITNFNKIDKDSSFGKFRNFGDCDTLIEASEDYISLDILKYIDVYTKDKRSIEVSEIKNSVEVETIKPKVKIYPTSDFYMLVVRGSLKRESSANSNSIVLEAGSLLRYNKDTPYSYFGSGYATIARIKIKLIEKYIDVKNFDIIESMTNELISNNFFNFFSIRTFDLFSFIKQIKITTAKAKDSFLCTNETIFFLIEGRANFVGKAESVIIKPDGFVMDNGRCVIEEDNTKIFHIDIKQASKIPFVMFKIAEFANRKYVQKAILK